MSAHYGSYDHREPVERLIDATPERFDLAALLAAFRPAWMDEARCTTAADPDAFFPTTGDRATQAKALCASCPVSETCLDYALTNGIGHGVWGGLNETERAKLRKAERTRIDHGTVSGYSAHRKRGEAACTDCLAAQRRRSAEQRAARRMAVAS